MLRQESGRRVLWHEALDKQSDLAAWWRSRAGRIYGEGFLKSLNLSRTQPWTGDLAKTEFGRLVQAPTYVMSDEMMSLISVAAESMPDQPLLKTDLPTQSGFLYLPYSIHAPDVHGRNCGIRAIVWDTVMVTSAQGVLFTFYSDVDDTEDGAYEKLQEMAFDLSTSLILMHIQPWEWGLGFRDMRSGLTESALKTILARPGYGSLDLDTVERAVEAGVREMRFMAAFWAMCRDYAHVRTERPTHRQHVKRLMRTQVWDEIPTVRVITLRRLREEGGEEEREPRGKLSHRFVVRGFWRDQWYPSLGPAKVGGQRNPESHRQKWIAPFVKGPEHAPLIVKSDVYRLVR